MILVESYIFLVNYYNILLPKLNIIILRLSDNLYLSMIIKLFFCFNVELHYLYTFVLFYTKFMTIVWYLT